jgi:hypothetical protein
MERIEWKDAASFHAIYPESEIFEAFKLAVRPYAARPALPELFESDSQSLLCISATVTQIIKAPISDGLKKGWKELEECIKEAGAVEVSFWSGTGIEADKGIFLGLIGWGSLEVSLHCLFDTFGN